jgi:ABC-2 type transport system permease protein
MATAVSIGTLLTAPAFGFMGIGFPRLGMSAFALGYGALLPGTWYLTARIDQTVRGTPVDLSWRPILILSTFVIALAGLCAWRLESRNRSARNGDAVAAPQPLAGAVS